MQSNNIKRVPANAAVAAIRPTEKLEKSPKPTASHRTEEA